MITNYPKKDVLIIGSGISGLCSAIKCAELGLQVYLVSQRVSEQSQSVLATGGINAAINPKDSVVNHANETYDAGCKIENFDDILAMCGEAPAIVEWLSNLGTNFTRNADGSFAQRVFGGQKFHRTCFAGTSTGKQIVSALVQKCREYEVKGFITRLTNLEFEGAIIKGGACLGAVFEEERGEGKAVIIADNVIIASGGMNGLYPNETTGSRLNTGYVAAKLFSQGVWMRNLEFVQYHPTTVKAQGKKLLISEAVRAEGGRLFIIENGERKYFMEDFYGPNGNLMTRDVVSRHVDATPSQVYLDISFLPKENIQERLEEVYNLCKQYLNIDIATDPIPVESGIHFFMGGIAVDSNHETNITNLYAVGEAASKYHGANRLGGNSLLAALYSGICASKHIGQRKNNCEALDMGFKLKGSVNQDYQNIIGILQEACALSKKARLESRGAFFREDYPNESLEFECSSIAKLVGGKIQIDFVKE